MGGIHKPWEKREAEAMTPQHDGVCDDNIRGNSAEEENWELMTSVDWVSKSHDLQACLAPVGEEHAHSRSSQILSCPQHGLWWLGFPVPIHNMNEFIRQQWFLAQYFEMMELFIMTNTWLPNWLLWLCHWLRVSFDICKKIWAWIVYTQCNTYTK